MSPVRRRLRAAGHVAGLWALAVAHPLLDVLGRAPEFFVAYRAGLADLVALVALIVLLPVAGLAAVLALADRAGRRASDGLTAALVGLLAALTSAQIGYRAGLDGWPATLAVATVSALLSAWAWLRLPGFGTFLTILSPAPLVVAALFFGSPGVRALVRPPAAPDASATRAARATPVVLLVFDELPLASLLDKRDLLDEHRYANVAALAADGVWFRNATTVSDYTRWAVPAILTASIPRSARSPACRATRTTCSRSSTRRTGSRCSSRAPRCARKISVAKPP